MHNLNMIEMSCKMRSRSSHFALKFIKLSLYLISHSVRSKISNHIFLISALILSSNAYPNVLYYLFLLPSLLYELPHPPISFFRIQLPWSYKLKGAVMQLCSVSCYHKFRHKQTKPGGSILSHTSIKALHSLLCIWSEYLS